MLSKTIAEPVAEPVQQADHCCMHVELTDNPSKADRHWHRLQQYCKSVFDLAQFKPLDAAPLLNASHQEEYNQAAIKLINQYYCAVNHVQEDLHRLSATDRLEVTSHLPEEEVAWLNARATPKQKQMVLQQASHVLEKARFAVADEEVLLEDNDLQALTSALGLWMAAHP